MSNSMENSVSYRKALINENSVQMTGTVIHLFHVPGTETVVMSLATSAGGSRSNYPKITWYGDLAQEVLASISEKDRVSLLGTVQTKRYDRTGGKTIYRQSFVGAGITRALKKIESRFGLEEARGEYVDDENEIRLAGTAFHIFKVPDKDIVILTVRTYTNGHVNMPKVTLFGRNAQYVLENIQENDPICVIGYAYTNRVEKADGTPGYYEGITCTSISPAPTLDEEG